VPPQIVEHLDSLAVNYDLLDFLCGGAGLMAILFFHGLCIALIYPWFMQRSRDMLHRRTYWRVEMLFFFSMFLLMMTHLGEIMLWAILVFQLGLVDTLRQAITFCGSTYTTVGYNSDLMPEGWKVMTMIIALSGMFSFAWTTGIMMMMLRPFHAAQYARITGRDPQNAPFSADQPKN
jgi:hypothetical protein